MPSSKQFDAKGGRLIRRLIGHSSWNLAALTVPLAVGIFTIPHLLNELGTFKFGTLTLFWSIIGYFSLFDLGVAKALTRRLAELRATDDRGALRGALWTGLTVMAVVGALGCAVIATVFVFAAPGLFGSGSDTTQDLRDASLIIALSVPLIVVTAGLRGALEAAEQFASANLVRLFLGVWMFLAPVAVISFGRSDLVALVTALVVGRVLSASVLYVLVGRAYFGWGGATFIRAEAKSLLAFGGWITVSGIVGPVMVYLDRFVVAAVVGAEAVAFFATPQDIATKLLFLPIAVNAVLLPLLAQRALSARDDQANGLDIIEVAIWATMALLAPLCLVLVVFSNEWLTLWLGGEFANVSAPLAQAFVFGAFLNVPGIILVAYLYANGRPKSVAILHLIELPIYMLALLIVLDFYGILGAAWLWAIRILLDSAILWAIASGTLTQLKRCLPRLGVLGSAVLVTGTLGAQTEVFALKWLAIIAGTIVVLAAAGHCRILSKAMSLK